VNIWQSYKQEGRYLVRYLCLLEVRWPGTQGARYNHLLAGNTHTHPLNGPFSGTTRVSRYQKGKTNLDFTEATESEWQWYQLGHMQVCISLQTENHAWRFDRFTSSRGGNSTTQVFFTGRMPFLPPNQQRQSTEGNTFLPVTLPNIHRF